MAQCGKSRYIDTLLRVPVLGLEHSRENPSLVTSFEKVALPGKQKARE